MKLIKAIFFHVYNFYYKDSSYTNDIPHLTAFGIVGCSLSCVLAAGVASINHLLNASRLSKPAVFIVYVLGLLISFLLFYANRRYDKIYEEIKDSKYDTITYKILSWVIVILGFSLIGIYSYLFNRVKS